MSKKSSIEAINKAIDLYKTGMSLRECGLIVGMHEDTLGRYFKKLNVPTRNAGQGRVPVNTMTNLPEVEICTSYNNGISENQLSKNYGISRNVIRRILKKHGCDIRSRSESEKNKWENMSHDQRKRQYNSAHKACTGRTRSQEELEKMALTRESNFPEWFVGIGEPELKQYFIENSIPFEYQKACMSYNLDFLLFNVDLELAGHIGRNKITNKFIYRRCSDVLSKGYKTLYVEFLGVDRLIAHADLILKTIHHINNGSYGDSHYILMRIFENRVSVDVMA